jgi:uncharacterized protein YidB (DUF937 family)
MGLLNEIEGLFTGELAHLDAAAIPTLLPSLLAKTNFGDLQGLITSLEQGGLGAQVRSWLGEGPNMAITPEHIQQALGSEQVQHLAQQFGLPIDGVLALLSQHLPAAVDQAKQSGTLQPQ